MDQFSFFGLTVGESSLDRILEAELRQPGIGAEVKRANEANESVDLKKLENFPRINMGGNCLEDQIIFNSKTPASKLCVQSFPFTNAVRCCFLL